MQDTPPSNILDTIIIGAGPAGLAAATYLARFNRRCLVLHAGDSRARYIPLAHNVPGFGEGISGPDLLARMTRQAETYGAEIRRFEVEELHATGRGFEVRGASQAVEAATILLATGALDLGPDIPGLEDAVRRQVLRICPICDGYEAAGKRLAVVGDAERCLGEALFLRHYGAEIAIVGARLDDKSRLKALQGDIAVYEDVEAMELLADRARFRLGGPVLEFDHVYAAYGCRPRSDLASSLKIDLSPGRYLATDEHQRTSIEGIWAAGDVVHSLSQISVACGQAAIAAVNIHNTLLARSPASATLHDRRRSAPEHMDDRVHPG